MRRGLALKACRGPLGRTARLVVAVGAIGKRRVGEQRAGFDLKARLESIGEVREQTGNSWVAIAR